MIAHTKIASKRPFPSHPKNMKTIRIEFITEDESYTYIKMSHVPRVGDTIFLINADTEMGDCVVTGVRWLIDASEDEDQADCVVVILSNIAQ